MSEKVLTQQDFKELPFSPSAQEAVLGHLLISEGLYNQVRLFMEPAWFSSLHHQAIFHHLKEYEEELGRFPNIESLKLYINLQNPDDSKKLNGMVDAAVVVSRTIQLEPIQDKLLNWLKARIYFNGLSESQSLFNRKKFDEAYDAIAKCSKDINEAKVKPDTEMEWSNPLATFEKQKLEYARGITFGIKCFDDLLLPEQTHGALLPGDTTVLLAPTNIGKCWGYGTKIIMLDGTTKEVQDIVTGDKLLGPDGKERNVLSTTSGISELFRIIPNTGGESFVCNDVHMLSLKYGWDDRQGEANRTGEIVNIPLNEFLTKSKDYQRRMRLYRAGQNFDEKELPIDPYILGVWLGDGHSDRAAFTTADDELALIWEKWVRSNGDNISTHSESEAVTYTAIGGTSIAMLRKLGVLKNKHIPHSYLTGSREQRLSLLAGLLDTDGSYSNDGNPNFEISQKNTLLANDIAFLCWSLGFKASVSKIWKECQTGAGGMYVRINVFGLLSQIPTVLDRKRAVDAKKDQSTTGFKVKPEGVGRYYGFTLDGDHLCLLGDFTVTHNTTTMITVAAHNVRRRKDILFLFHEGRPLDIQLKIWCNLLGVSMSELLGLYKNEPERVDKMAQVLQEHFVLVPVFKPGLTVEEVEEVIARRVKEHQDKYGRGFDLIVDDYPAKLTTKMAQHGMLATRNMYQYVYNYFVQIGLYHQTHILGAIQTNREGSRINANLEDASAHRLIGLEDVHESFGTMQDVCNVISINRDNRAKAEERVTFVICKSRSSKTGWVVVCKSDYGHACTHGDHLGATYYEGDAPPDKNIEELIKRYNGKQIPIDQMVHQD